MSDVFAPPTPEELEQTKQGSMFDPPSADELAAAEHERIREIVRPSLSTQLGRMGLADAVGVASEAAESVPLAGPLVKRGAAALAPEDAPEYEQRRAERYRRLPDVMGGAHAVGTIGGALALPSPAGKVNGLVAAPAARAVEGAAVFGGDAALRDQDPTVPALAGAGMGGLSGVIRPKTFNRVVGGIPDEMQDYYVANREAVNAARARPELGQAMVAEGRAASRDVSSGSTEAYRVLEQSGKELPLSEITGPIDAAIARLEGGGRFGDATKGVVAKLQELRSDAVAESTTNGTIEAVKVKNFVNAFRDTTKAYEKGPGPGQPPNGRNYVTGVLRGADQAIDGALKRAVPEYEAAMKPLARATAAFKPVQRALRDENTADTFVRQMMNQRNPEGVKALREFDKVRGTDFANELKASYTKEFFNRPNMAGSRQVNLGRAVGRVGGPIGEAVGGMVGAAQDVYARKVGKALLDMSAAPLMRPWADLIAKAYQRSPATAMGLHGLLWERDEAYRNAVQQLTGEEQSQ